MAETQKSFTPLYVLLAISLVLSAVVLIALPKGVDETALADKVTAQVISQIPAPEPVPTAAEIAAEIKVPEVTVPEFKSDQKVDEVWKEVYSDEIDELNTEAYNVAVDKLSDHDYRLLEKYLEANVADFDELETTTIKDYEVTAVNMGLKTDEDKVATVDFTLKARYTLLNGDSDDQKKTLHAIATVTFDKGDYSDEDVEIVFS